MNKTLPTNRSYWRVNMKWVIALIFIPVFAVTFLLFNLYVITDETNSIKVSSVLLKEMYSPGNNTNANEVQEIRAAIKKSPNKVLLPFPGVDIKITEGDLDKYSTSDIKTRVFQELAKNIYNFDSSKKENNHEGKKGILSNLGLMAIFTKEGHVFLGNILVYAVLASALPLSLLIYFSYGFGRLVSPGVVAIIVGLPIIVFLTVLQKKTEESGVILGTSEISIQQRLSAFIGAVGPTISDIFLKNYSILTVIGVILIVAGLIGRIIQGHKSKQKHIL